MFAILCTFFGTGVAEAGWGVVTRVGGGAVGKTGDCEAMVRIVDQGVGTVELFIVDERVVERSDSVSSGDEESEGAEMDVRRVAKRPLTRGWFRQLSPVILRRGERVRREDGTR